MIPEIDRFVSRAAGTVVRIIKTAAGILSGSLTLVFIVISLISRYPASIALAILSAAATVIFFTPTRDRYSYRHLTELKRIRFYYNHVQALLKKAGFFNDPETRRQLRSSLKQSLVISADITQLVKTLSLNEWNRSKINRIIRQEEKKSLPDTALIEKLKDKIKNITQLEERETLLRNRLTAICVNIENIYSQVTLVLTETAPASDEIETEIRKILDRRLAVQRQEEKLRNDLNPEI
jgi:hypothetical protein